MLTLPFDIRRLLRGAQTITVLGGSGISAPSGIPTYRSGPSPLWGTKPEGWLNPRTFAADPDGTWQWHLDRLRDIRAREPNAAHHALRSMERSLTLSRGELRLYTQNIDDLHERAGSVHTVHLHGELARWRCPTCQERGDVGEQQPLCSQGHATRPDVVWYEEDVPLPGFQAAMNDIGRSDLLIVAGTSLVVSPVNRLPQAALGAGIPVLEINPQRTALSRRRDAYHVHAGAHEVLPAIAAALSE